VALNESVAVGGVRSTAIHIGAEEIGALFGRAADAVSTWGPSESGERGLARLQAPLGEALTVPISPPWASEIDTVDRAGAEPINIGCVSFVMPSRMPVSLAGASRIVTGDTVSAIRCSSCSRSTTVFRCFLAVPGDDGLLAGADEVDRAPNRLNTRPKTDDMSDMARVPVGKGCELENDVSWRCQLEKHAGDRVRQAGRKLGGPGKLLWLCWQIDYRPGRTRVKQVVWPLADR